MKQLNPLADGHQLLLGELAGAFTLLQQGPQLLHLGQQQAVASLRHGRLLLQLLVLVEGFIQLKLDVLENASQTCD
jgi:hypothetical protein